MLYGKTHLKILQRDGEMKNHFALDGKLFQVRGENDIYF